MRFGMHDEAIKLISFSEFPYDLAQEEGEAE